MSNDMQYLSGAAQHLQAKKLVFSFTVDANSGMVKLSLTPKGAEITNTIHDLFDADTANPFDSDPKMILAVVALLLATPLNPR